MYVLKYNGVKYLIAAIALACAPVVPKLTPTEQCAQDESLMCVSVDNTSGREDVTVWVNNYRLGRIGSYHSGIYTMPRSALIERYCGIAEAWIDHGTSMRVVTSAKACLRNNYESFRIQITNDQKGIWLT